MRKLFSFRIRGALLLPFIAVIACGNLIAQDDAPKGEEKGKKEKDEMTDNVSVTKHSGTFGGRELKYTATAGTIVISKKEKDPKASMFHVAYTLDGVKDPKTRPITFCFNGGPGSSGVWLHLGGFGPKRVQMTKDGMMPNPPFRLGDNPDSILRVTDLVFIDPGQHRLQPNRGRERGGRVSWLSGRSRFHG